MKKILGFLIIGMLISSVSFSAEKIVECKSMMEDAGCNIVIETGSSNNYVAMYSCLVGWGGPRETKKYDVILPIERISKSIGFCTTTIKVKGDSEKTFSFDISSKTKITDKVEANPGLYSCSFYSNSSSSKKFFEDSQCWPR